MAQYKYIIPAGTPIIAIANVRDPASPWVKRQTRRENQFHHMLLSPGEAERSPETLYEGGMETGWDNKHCNYIYTQNTLNGLSVFTQCAADGSLAVMLVDTQFVDHRLGA
jgi:hypothetical protein